MNEWKAKIEAIKIAADNADDPMARAKVDICLARGVAHMEYKDFEEFGCSCEEQYIFQEAAHLLDEIRMPFDMALNMVKADAEHQEWIEKELQEWNEKEGAQL